MFWKTSSPVFRLFIVGVGLLPIAFALGDRTVYGMAVGAFLIPWLLTAIAGLVARVAKKTLPNGFQYGFIGVFGGVITLMASAEPGRRSSNDILGYSICFAISGVLLLLAIFPQGPGRLARRVWSLAKATVAACRRMVDVRFFRLASFLSLTVLIGIVGFVLFFDGGADPLAKLEYNLPSILGATGAVFISSYCLGKGAAWVIAGFRK